MFDLSGKKALVTGGARGIGRAITQALWDAGADVAIFGRNVEAANAFCQELAAGASDRTARAYGVDVSEPEAVAGTVKTVGKEMGGLDIVVNNAGITRDNVSLRMTDEEWRAVMDTNLRGAFEVSRAAFGALRKSAAGRIINISSVVGVIGNAGQANYAAAKAGLIGLTKSLAREYAPRNITVNAVAPGYIETDMTAALNAEARQALMQQSALGRLGRPEDIAPAVVFLASTEAGYVTGQVLNVCGGMVM